MIFHFRQEIQNQLRSFSDWSTAFALFAATCFIIAWPLKDDLAVTAQVGPSTVWALIVLTQFLVFAKFWHSDLASGLGDIVLGQSPAQAAGYTRGRMLAAALVGVVYTVIAVAVGWLLFAMPTAAFGTLAIQSLILSPAVTSLSIATSALVSTARGNTGALGIVAMAPLLAPMVIFSGIYAVEAHGAQALTAPSLWSLIGLCILYCAACFTLIPGLVKSQL